MSSPLIFPMKITRTKDLNLVANNLRRLEDNGADIREPRSPYLMPHGGKVDGGAQGAQGREVENSLNCWVYGRY